MLAMGLFVGYSYLVEAFTSWYSGDVFELALLRHRASGPYATLYWLSILCNVGAPQTLWLGSARRHPWLLFAVAIAVNVGMWLERYIIIVASLSQDFLPSSWGMFHPTVWDYATFFGSMGLFLLLLLLFVRFLPMISIFETREIIAAEEAGA